MHEREVARGWVCVDCAAEAAARRGRRTIDRWHAAGLVRAQRVGRRVFYNLSDVLDAEAATSRGKRPAEQLDPVDSSPFVAN